MVNMLTQQVGTVFNPLIQSTNKSYQLLYNHMGRIIGFFSAPQAQAYPIPQIAPVRPIGMPDNGDVHINLGQH